TGTAESPSKAVRKPAATSRSLILNIRAAPKNKVGRGETIPLGRVERAAGGRIPEKGKGIWGTPPCFCKRVRNGLKEKEMRVALVMQKCKRVRKSLKTRDRFFAQFCKERAGRSNG